MQLLIEQINCATLLFLYRFPQRNIIANMANTYLFPFGANSSRFCEFRGMFVLFRLKRIYSRSSNASQCRQLSARSLGQNPIDITITAAPDFVKKNRQKVSGVGGRFA